jgi:HEPN domain-containing protein
LPTPEHREVAQLLLDKAADDLSAAKALIAAGGQADHVVGFHLQQTVEKAVKAVLAVRAVEIPRTHDLAYVVEQASDGGATVPESLTSIEWLTPWGVLFRYDAQDMLLDRAAGVRAAEEAIAWSTEEIAG